MLTPDESRALAVLAALVAVGAGLTVLEVHRPDVLALTLGDSLALGFVSEAGDSVPAPARAPTSPRRPVAAADSTSAPDTTATPSAYSADGRLDLNRATAEELEGLPGIGPKTAERIVADRTKRGRFRAIKDLGRVKGIGPKTLARLTPHLIIEKPRKP